MSTTTPNNTPPATAASSNTNNKNNNNDYICAKLAREALFPKRMHRDVAHANHFPALIQLDLLRDYWLPTSTVSAIFPRHVLVVQNVADGTLLWNGVPDIITTTTGGEGQPPSPSPQQQQGVKFDVIPNKVSVRCTSECNTLLKSATQRAFVVKEYNQHNESNDNDNNNDNTTTTTTEIVLCTDRILQNDYKDKKYTGVAKELPPKTMQAVEEVLAHQLAVQVHELQQQGQGQPPPLSSLSLSSKEKDDKHNVAVDPKAVQAAQIQMIASKVAECYYSRHTYDNQVQVKRGSRLSNIGFSWWWPWGKTSALQHCITTVATEHLQYSNNFSGHEPLSKKDAQLAIRIAMTQQQKQQEQNN